MTHPDEGALMALVDGERPPGEPGEVARHAERCADCHARLTDLRARRTLVSEALRGSEPDPATEAAYRTVHARRAAARARPLGPLRWAAVITLAAATGLAAAVPGSPVRDWLGERGAPETRETVATLETAEPDAAAAATSTGVSVLPAGERMTVRFVDPDPGVRIVVHTTAEPRLDVTAGEPVEGMRFLSAADHVEVRRAAGTEVHVAVPEGLPHFRLEVDGRLLMEKREGDVRMPVAPVRTAGPGIVYEIRP